MHWTHCWYPNHLSPSRFCFQCCSHLNQQCSCLKSIDYSTLLLLICFYKLVTSMCHTWLVACLIIVMSRDWGYCTCLLFVSQSKLPHCFFLVLHELSPFFCCITVGRQYLLVVVTATSSASMAPATTLATTVTPPSTTPTSAPNSWDVPGCIFTLVCRNKVAQVTRCRLEIFTQIVGCK